MPSSYGRSTGIFKDLDTRLWNKWQPQSQRQNARSSNAASRPQTRGGAARWKLNPMAWKLNKRWEARSRLYRRQSLEVNTRWKALACAPLRPQYFSKSSFFAFSTLETLNRLHFLKCSSWFSLIFMKFARIFSDLLEKRCNYSKVLDFNLILSWLYQRFISFSI